MTSFGEHIGTHPARPCGLIERAISGKVTAGTEGGRDGDHEDLQGLHGQRYRLVDGRRLMACYHQILVALDGSRDAEAALRHAATLARDQHARLTLLTVAPPPSTAAGAGASQPPDLLDLQAKIIREATDWLPDDIGVTTRLERGDAAETILRVAREDEPDLIVMGSHGRGRIRRALLGSVSERVLRASAVPVLLMRGAQDGAKRPC
jgi:nucleotide-binding universal stress UspA family protein